MNQTVRDQRMEGLPGFEIGDRTADLFDDAPAAPQESKLGPVFTATYGSEDDCCGEGIEPGDRIRADGHGGWIHEGCEDE